MVEGEDTGWMTVLEKKGLHQSTEILENYGIESETDVSLFDRDDLFKLTSLGFKTMEGKKQSGTVSNGSSGVGTMEILLDRSHTLSQKYRTCRYTMKRVSSRPIPRKLWGSKWILSGL